MIEKGVIERFAICKDACCDTIYLLINTSSREQFKILLEQKSTGYLFPADGRGFQEAPRTSKREENENEWEVVQQANEAVDSLENPIASTSEDFSKLFTASKARLMSLRDLGAKKIGNLKMKLAESRNKNIREKEKADDSGRYINSSSALPEPLTTPTGPYFTVQTVQNKNVMGAIHSYTSTLSIHNIEIMLIPSSLYKLPSCYASDVLLTETVIYIHQPPTQSHLTMSMSTSVAIETPQNDEVIISSQETNVESSSYDENSIKIISCNLASAKIGEECEFNERALLGTFKFPLDEKILYVFPLLSNCEEITSDSELQQSNNDVEMKSTYSKYLNYSKSKNNSKFDDVHDAKVLKNEFPRVTFEKCLIITSKGVYSIELKEKPHIIFLNLAATSQWALCDDFCKTFNLNMTECVEFSGDILLRKKKIEQALLTYNIARIPPIKTALKLAMFNETAALRQISAMALKISFILESKHPMSHIIYELLKEVKERHERSDIILKSLRDKDSTKPIIAEKIISDFTYNSSDNFDVQMSNSAQFHLSNLLFLTLCERAVKDKNLMPLWNFIVSNTKYHTSLSSIILSQSGLYSSAILLAMHRGACLDVFSCLVSMADHVFGKLIFFFINLNF